MVRGDIAEGHRRADSGTLIETLDGGLQAIGIDAQLGRQLAEIISRYAVRLFFSSCDEELSSVTLTVIPLNNMGVEVAGLDVAQPISDALKRDLIKLWDEHGVLLFRDQAIDPQTQIKFSHIFGDLAKAYDALDEASKVLLGKIEVTYTFSMQRRHMRFVDLEGYEPGAFSPIKPGRLVEG